MPEIYDSQLEKIENQFVRIVANMLDKIPRERKTRNSEK